MNVEAASGAQTYGNGTQQVAAPQTVDYQAFLRLLVAEMKNQDPTSPMESTDYVAQLATFSQVEQSVQANAKLDQILQRPRLRRPAAWLAAKSRPPMAKRPARSPKSVFTAMVSWPFWKAATRSPSDPAS